MPRDFFDPTQNVVLIDAVTLREAERLVEACERCRPYEAEIPFDVILDHVTASDPSVTDYILESPAKCPNCRREIFGKDPSGTEPMDSGGIYKTISRYVHLPMFVFSIIGVVIVAWVLARTTRLAFFGASESFYLRCFVNGWIASREDDNL
jgi:hypothetical protein